MSSKLSIENITSGYRPIKDGREYTRYFPEPNDNDRIIIEDGDVDDTVELMMKVVWKYIDDTKKIATYLKGSSIKETSENIWNFLYNHIQYKLDKRGLEQLRRPARSWSDRTSGIDCDCFSIFVSSILTNLQIPHKLRIAKYNQDVFQHVYVIVPFGGSYYTIDCVISEFNHEKPYTEIKDFTMKLNGINVAVLSGTVPNVMELVNDLEGLENLGSDNEQERLEAIYSHLVKTRNMIANKPYLVEHVDYPPAFLKMLDYAIENWNTPNRDKALAILQQNEDALNLHNNMAGIPENSDLEGLDDEWEEIDGYDDDEIQELLGGKKERKEKRKKKKEARKEKKQEKKEKKQERKEERKAKKAEKKEQRKEAKKTKKGFFRKIGEAVKKGGKAFIRFNPVTIAARNGFLLAIKLNIKKMASKLKWAYGTQQQAAAKGISADQWQKSKTALAKIEKLFADKLQGKRDKLKNAILKGKAGGLSGFDDEFILQGLGVAPAAAAMVAAMPVIALALKALVESGLMTKNEADGLQAELDAKAEEGEMLLSDPNFAKDVEDEGDDDDDDDDDDSKGDKGKGIMNFIKNPLVIAGGAGLALWGISKLLSKKPTKSKSLEGTPNTKEKKSSRAKNQKSKSKKEHIKSILLK